MQDPKKKLKFHGGFYRGRSAYIDFWVKGQRYTECLGPVAPSVARDYAAKRKSEILQNRLGLGTQQQDNLTFHEFIESKYLPFYKSNRKPSTFDRGKRILRILVNEFGSITLRNISHRMIEDFKQRLMARALAPASVNQHLAILQGSLQRAVEWGYLSINPMNRVELLPVHNARVRFLTDQEEKMILAALPARLRPIVTFAINTGFRMSEITTLKWGSVDFQTGLITVQSAYSKNYAPRNVPMNNTVRQLLQSLPDHDPNSLVFTLGHSRIRELFHDAVIKTGLQDIRFHDLRHTFASRLVMAGVDIRTVQDLMGHNLLVMTLRYSHLSDTHRKNAVERLEGTGA